MASTAARAPLKVVMHGHAIGHRVSADGFLVAEGMRSGGRVNHQLQRTGFQQIDRVRAALVDFEDGLALQPGGVERGGGAARGDELESRIRRTACATCTASALCDRSR